MPSTALQSRISAFESLAAPSSSSSSSSSPASPPSSHTHNPPKLNGLISSRHTPPASPSPSPPNLGRRTSLIDLRDWVVDDGPSPTHTNGSTSPGMSGANGRTPTKGAFDTKKQLTTPLINFESPPKPKPKPANLSTKAPPLPPRKPSFASLKSAASSSFTGASKPSHRSESLTVDHTYPPINPSLESRSRNSSGHAPASSISSFHSVSLSSDTDPSTPGSVANFIATFPIDQLDQDRDRDFSIRSNGSETDSISLGESYEEVSTPSIASPATEKIISMDWENAMAKRKVPPPRLPQRPASTQSTSLKPPLRSPPARAPQRPSSTPGSSGFRSSASSASTSYATTAQTVPTRRAPPPPPTSRSSDRSSIQSTTTSHSSSTSNNSHYAHLNNVSMKTKRPAPVPMTARSRYESVFNANVMQQRKAERLKGKEKPALLSPTEARRTRQAAGWRGLSVDLITGGDTAPASALVEEEEEEDTNSIVDSTDRLEGLIIKAIWHRSRLDRGRLADIWNECDPTNTGSLDRDGFIKGMWRIDEELRRARTEALKSAGSTSLGSFRAKAKAKTTPSSRSKLILR